MTHLTQEPLAAPPTVPPAARERFALLAAEWKAQARHLSNTKHITQLPPYQEIIAMGSVAIPLILEELQREPRQWFWALRQITGGNPEPPEAAGNVKAKAAAWIAWGKQHGYLPV